MEIQDNFGDNSKVYIFIFVDIFQRMNIGLRAFFVIADNLQRKVSEHIQDRTERNPLRPVARENYKLLITLPTFCLGSAGL